MTNPAAPRMRYVEFALAAILIGFAAWDAWHILNPGEDAKTPSWWGIALTPWLTPAIALILAGIFMAGLRRELVEKIDRPLEILVALIFLWSAYLKGIKVSDFAAQINVYGIDFLKPYLGPVALTTLTLETFIAVGMLLALRLRFVVLLLAEGMLVFFTLLITYAWPENCGCMGEVVITPPQAIGKNLILITMIAISWRGFLWEVRMPPSARPEIIKAVVAVVAAIAVLAYAYPQLYKDDRPAEKPKPPKQIVQTDQPKTPAPSAPVVKLQDRNYAGYVVETEFGETLDLSQGEYLVTSLSMTCDHCKAIVPALNQLMYLDGLPRLVALCHEPEPDSMEIFKIETSPQFPMHPIGDDFLEFSKVIGATPPRVAYVYDGYLIQAWDEEEVPIDAIITRVEELRAIGDAAEAAGEISRVDAMAGAS